MTTINLEKLTDEKLAELILNAQNLLNDRQDLRRQEAIDEIQRLAEDHGLAIEINAQKLKPKRKKKARRVAQPKYRNPESPEQTWNGLGPRPKWIRAFIAAGNAIEELEIAGE